MLLPTGNCLAPKPLPQLQSYSRTEPPLPPRMARSVERVPLSTVPLLLCAYPVQITRLYRPLPSNGRLFQLQHSGLSAVVSRYYSCWSWTTLCISSFKHSTSGLITKEIFLAWFGALQFTAIFNIVLSYRVELLAQQFWETTHQTEYTGIFPLLWQGQHGLWTWVVWKYKAFMY
jgi:hypothetical protein